ncbi:MAG TPA: YcxB family protein [Verrucomicrobiae bacterium]|nr:YcxB family protein [Verrucomicrobiae bacterium]
MDVRCTLSLEDHLAWYDYYLATPEGARFRSTVPLVGVAFDKIRRWKYSRQVTSPPSRHALGERTLEATETGLREFSPDFSFTTAWSDIGLMAVTSNYLFLAHKSLNAHIVPLHFFGGDGHRESFISFAESHVSTDAVQK